MFPPLRSPKRINNKGVIDESVDRCHRAIAARSISSCCLSHGLRRERSPGNYFPHYNRRRQMAMRSCTWQTLHTCKLSSNPLDALTRTAKTERSMSGKYELLKEDCIEYDGRTLYRIRALRDFRSIKQGDLGGYIEKEENLSHEGEAWVFDNARVSDNAWVSDDARYTAMHRYPATRAEAATREYRRRTYEIDCRNFRSGAKREREH